MSLGTILLIVAAPRTIAFLVIYHYVFAEDGALTLG